MYLFNNPNGFYISKLTDTWDIGFYLVQMSMTKKGKFDLKTFCSRTHQMYMYTIIG